MILDARTGDYNYDIFDVKRCRAVTHVVWVNDQTAQWGRYTGGVIGWELEIETVQEDRISIYPSRNLILFNEVDDASDTTTDQRVVEKTV